MLSWNTDKKEQRTCRHCSGSYLHQEVIDQEGRKSWSCREAHRAPCGLHCMGGGIRDPDGFAALKSKQIHGSALYPCPACGHGCDEVQDV